jgi:hypothetical protein
MLAKLNARLGEGKLGDRVRDLTIEKCVKVFHHRIAAPGSGG